MSIPLEAANSGSLTHTSCEGSLLLRCLRKFGITLQSKPGNQLSSRDDLGCSELSMSCCAEIDDHLDVGRVSQGISGVA